MMELWPFTNFHDMNLDWIIKTIKVYTKKVDDFITDITQTWNDFKDWVSGEIDQMHEDFAEYVNVTEGALNTGAIANGAITKNKVDADFLLEIENGYVTPEMYGAIGDGVTDDTAAINAAMATGKNVYFPNAAYLITDSIIPTSNQTINGNNATIKTDDAVNIFRLTDLKSTSIRDVNLEGDAARTSVQIGIACRNCENIYIDNVYMKHLGGDGIYFSECDNCQARTATIEDASIAAFAYNSTNMLFEDMTIIEPRFKYGVQYKSCSNSTMSNIFIYTPQDIGLYISKGNEDDANDTYDIELNNIVVIDQGQNGVSGGTQASISLEDGYNFKLYSATVKNGLNTGIRLSASESTITQAFVDGCNTGLDILNDDNIITECTITNNTLFGVRVRNASNVNIGNNTIKNNSDDNSHGNIILDTTANIQIIGNYIDMGTDATVNLQVTTSITGLLLTGNIFINKTEDGNTYDYWGVYDFTNSTVKDNGMLKYRQLHSLNIYAVIEWNKDRLTVYGYGNAAPTWSDFNEGDIVTARPTATANYIGWVYRGGTWKGYGAVEA